MKPTEAPLSTASTKRPDSWPISRPACSVEKQTIDTAHIVRREGLVVKTHGTPDRRFRRSSANWDNTPPARPLPSGAGRQISTAKLQTGLFLRDLKNSDSSGYWVISARGLF